MSTPDEKGYDPNSKSYLLKRAEHTKYVNSGQGDGEAAKALRRLKASKRNSDGVGKGDLAGTNPASTGYLNACAINDMYERGEITLDEWRTLIKENK